MAFVRSIRLDAAGYRRFSGASTMPGADVWPGGETSRGLDPDGWMVRRQHNRHHVHENRDASEATSRGGVCLREHNGEKWSKVVTGEVLSLDKSLLMGGSPSMLPLLSSPLAYFFFPPFTGRSTTSSTAVSRLPVAPRPHVATPLPPVYVQTRHDQLTGSHGCDARSNLRLTMGTSVRSPPVPDG